MKIRTKPRKPTRKPIRNPMRFDPTRTRLLRDGMVRELNQRFAAFRKDVVDMIVGQDALGLIQPNRDPSKLAANAQDWRFLSDPQKVKAFQAWLKNKTKQRIAKGDEDKLWYAYAEAGFKKGAGRSYDDVKARLRAQTYGNKEKLDFYKGSKDQFLKDSFTRPVAIDKIKLIAGRAYTDLEGVTEQMSVAMTRTLADGLVQGKSPRDIANDLVKNVDNIGAPRARTIARTEIIRAHAEGQLNALEDLGVEKVGVMVEWEVTDDDKVCELCLPLEGVVLKIAEARGMLPRHPNCRCAFVPANVGEDPDGQVRTRGAISKAIALSQEREGKEEDDEGGVWGPGQEISKARPQSILNQLTLTYNAFDSRWPQITNVFCPTGPGGGINPHCSPGGAGGNIVWGHDIHTGQGLADLFKHNLQHPMADKALAKLIHLNPQGVKNGTLYVPYPYLSVTGQAQKNQEKLDDIRKLMPPGTVIKSKDVSMAKLGAIPTAQPVAAAPAVAAPSAPKSSGLPQVPYQTETNWETGVAQPAELNGIPFAPAPHKFWEKTPDVPIKEPKETRPIVRASVIIKEKDGRVWIVKPTNAFGGRTYTIPGGTNEPHLTNQQNALKEVWEETGLQVKITGHAGDFEDSNNGRVGRTYFAERIGGAPWDAKIEDGKGGGPRIINQKTGKAAAESETVSLVTPEKAAQLLHRTDDLAQIATVAPIAIGTKTNGNMMKKLVDGVEPAAAQYKKDMRAASKSPGDATLHAVQELRGFNGKPTVVSKKDMNNLVAQGTHIEMLRGVKGTYNLDAKDLANEFKTGDHYPGYGCFGSGTYADSNKGSYNVANGNYGRGGDVIRMALPKTANIIKQSELESKVIGSPSNFSNSYTGHHGASEAWQGIQAALAGYDAIEVDGRSNRHGSYGKGFYVILNRSILTVQKESGKGHQIQ